MAEAKDQTQCLDSSQTDNFPKAIEMDIGGMSKRQ